MRTVRHTERRARSTLVLVDCLGTLEDEGLGEAIEKPPGILYALDSNLTITDGRAYPHTERIHDLAPINSAAGDCC